MEITNGMKKQIESKDSNKEEEVSNLNKSKDLRKKEDSSSDIDSLYRSIYYNDDIKDDIFPNVLDFLTNSYFYNQDHIYDYLKQNLFFDLNKEKTFFVLSDSIFNLSVEYKRDKNEAFIKYKKITCKNLENVEEEFNIEEIKNLTSELYELKYYYKKFLDYLNKFEKELKKYYKSDNETEIELRFKMQNFGDDYIINCELLINDENFEENSFKDENILNFSDHHGLYLIIEALNDY